MSSGNPGVQYTIPSCLKPGYYLVRHELIALHASYSYPGAQFYPGCHQLQVTGSGSIQPSSLVAFPGAYKSTDPGITYDAYKGEKSRTIPQNGSSLLFPYNANSCPRLTNHSHDVHYPRTRCVLLQRW